MALQQGVNGFKKHGDENLAEHELQGSGRSASAGLGAFGTPPASVPDRGKRDAG